MYKISHAFANHHRKSILFGELHIVQNHVPVFSFENHFWKSSSVEIGVSSFHFHDSSESPISVRRSRFTRPLRFPVFADVRFYGLFAAFGKGRAASQDTASPIVQAYGIDG